MAGLAQPVADERSIAADLPPELLACIAEYLAPRELFSAALVCDGWRAALLGIPPLWTRLCVVQRDRDASSQRRSVVNMLSTLFARSQNLPLHIELSCASTEPLDEYNAIATTLKGQLHRMRSLSLVLPMVKGTFAHILRTPAPALECFRMHSAETSMYRLPNDLFARNAPHLTRISLSGMALPSMTAGVGCSALRAITDLVYDTRTIENVDLDAIIHHVPALQSLTLLAHTCAAGNGDTCLLPVHLRLPNIKRISGVIEAFPNAASVCLYSSQRFWDNGELWALADSLRHITSMGMRYCSQRHLVSGGRGPNPTQSRWIAVSVNGAYIAVELSLHEATSLVRELSYQFDNVRSVVVHEKLWRDLARYDLPTLDELTMLLSDPAEPDDGRDALLTSRRWDATYLLRQAETPTPRHDTALLRLAVPPGSRMFDLRDSVVAEVIRALCDPGVLRTLVLRGVGLDMQFPKDDHRSLNSLVLELKIVREVQRLDQDVEPWCWTLPTEDAVHA
ncbi:hypothetical protein AURDEDRAFT_167181 [Auricularia subglabra TFB-10046 SS5]|nr:hypothetical protein AURDEDRAFT_167181 [Auricularia subglabra TFB-10046 SS5]